MTDPPLEYRPPWPPPPPAPPAAAEEAVRAAAAAGAAQGFAAGEGVFLSATDLPLENRSRPPGRRRRRRLGRRCRQGQGYRRRCRRSALGIVVGEGGVGECDRPAAG